MIIKKVQVNVRLPVDLVKSLKKRLIDDDLTLTDWIEQRAKLYVLGEAPQPSRRPRRRLGEGDKR